MEDLLRFLPKDGQIGTAITVSLMVLWAFRFYYKHTTLVIADQKAHIAELKAHIEYQRKEVETLRKDCSDCSIREDQLQAELDLTKARMQGEIDRLKDRVLVLEKQRAEQFGRTEGAKETAKETAQIVGKQIKNVVEENGD